MAKFRFLNHKIPGVTMPGLSRAHKIRFHHADGSYSHIVAADPKVGFLGGEIFELKEKRAIRHARVDPGFQEVPDTATVTHRAIHVPRAKV